MAKGTAQPQTANNGKGGNVYQQSAAALGQAGAGMGQAGAAYAGLTGYKPAVIGAAPTMRAVNANAAQASDPAAISGGIPGYMRLFQNQFEQGVVDAATADVQRLTGQQQTVNGANAAAAGAFGGSRHGLVEAETNLGAQRTIADMAANLRNNNFQQSAALSSGLATQDVANGMQVGALNAGMEQQTALTNAAAQNAAAGSNQSAAITAALADQQARNTAGVHNSNLGAVKAGGILSAATAGQGLGQTLFGIGNNLTGQQSAQGAAQQATVQGVLDAAQQQFAGYTGQGKDMLGMISSILSGSPLNNATTQTTQTNPGLLSTLAVISGAAQNGMGGGAGGGGKGGKGGKGTPIVP